MSFLAPESAPEQEVRSLHRPSEQELLRLLSVVDRHRVAPLIWARLKEADLDGVPAALLSELSARQRDNVREYLASLGELLRLDSLLAEANIAYLTLKGIPLAARYYADATQRHVGDIDVLVAEPEFERTYRLLQSAGYTPINPLDGLTTKQRRYLMATSQHSEFMSPRAEIVIELHWRAMFVNPLDQPAHQEVAGCKLPVLADEEMLLYLCAHGAEHAWFRLKWLFDLPRILESREWDWPTLFRKAHEYRCEQSFALGLLVANRLLDWPLPASVVDWMHDIGDLEAQYSFVKLALRSPESWWSGRMPTAILPRWITYHMRLLPGTSSWYREIKQNATARQDWETLPLPDALFWLYFPLRPFLVAWRRLRRL